MASNFVKLSALSRRVLLSSPTLRSQMPVIRRNFEIYNGSGALNPKPDQVQFGTIKVLATVVPFLWTGAFISKNGAAFLEENDIFVPDDDDD